MCLRVDKTGCSYSGTVLPKLLPLLWYKRRQIGLLPWQPRQIELLPRQPSHIGLFPSVIVCALNYLSSGFVVNFFAVFSVTSGIRTTLVPFFLVLDFTVLWFVYGLEICRTRITNKHIKLFDFFFNWIFVLKRFYEFSTNICFTWFAERTVLSYYVSFGFAF